VYIFITRLVSIFFFILLKNIKLRKFGLYFQVFFTKIFFPGLSYIIDSFTEYHVYRLFATNGGGGYSGKIGLHIYISLIFNILLYVKQLHIFIYSIVSVVS